MRADWAGADDRLQLAINPDAADVHNNLAVAFGARREYQRAVYHLNRALVIREGYPEAHNNLAIAMGALGRFDEALRHATRALELQPDYADARDNLRLIRDAQQPAPRIR